MTPVALTIAGSDPSGGAGIQADLRTFAALGVAGLSAITALTVQNSQGVQSVHPVAPDVLAAQLEAVLSDTRPTAVKIGMLGGAEQVRVVIEALRQYGPPNVVLDPVFASTGGVPLLNAEGRRLLLTDLLPLCDLVTPNLDELGGLTGVSVGDQSTSQAAVQSLLDRGARGVLLKGGHFAGEPIDRLKTRSATTTFFGKRVETPHTHGTGCALSAGVAAGLAKGQDLHQSIEEAKRLLTRALQHPTVVGQGRGYPDLLTASRLDSQGDYRSHHERLALLHGLYVITDAQLMPNRSHLEITRAALTGGARIIQLRDKTMSIPQLITTARRLRHLTQEAGALLLINDHVDVALVTEADGVHLGPEDFGPSIARRVLGPDKLVGVSVNSVQEAELAAPFASYFGVGAIFGSSTKSDAGPPIGLGRIGEIKAAFPHIPVVAIGGISRENIASVAEAGANAAAVISAVVSAPDMEAATRELRDLFVRA